MKAIIFLFLLLNSFVLSAQNGYELNFNIKKSSKDTLELGIYNASSKKFYIIDEIPLLKKGSKVKQPSKIIGALYRLQFKGADENDYINIAVEDGSRLEFELEGDNIKNIKTEDPVNGLFIKAENASSISEKNVLYQQLVDQYPNSTAALYARLRLAQSQKLPPITEMDSLQAIQENYFNGVDLNDKRIPLLPNIYATLFDYIKVLPINNANYQKAIDRLLQGQDCDSPNFMFYLKWAFMNLEYLNRFNLYDSFLYVFNQYLNQGKCIAENEEFYNRVVKSLQNYEKVPIGSIIPDFEMVDADGNRYQISDLYPKHKYTFIAFYDPDCSHCKEKMPEINTYFNQLKNQSKIDVQQMAYLNAVSDYAWKYFIEEKELKNWMHVKSDDPKLKYITDLNVFANPAFFLVDQQGTIIMKNFNPTEMTKLFNSNP